jgi:hypothetical protein
VIQAFHDGGAIIQKIKKKRALKRAPPPPRLLEESIDQAPYGILQEKKRGIARFGRAFEQGDHITIIALQQITIQLQSSFLEKLRNAAFDDDHAITDFTYLTDAADLGRDRTIATLHEFKQRLLNASSQPEDQSLTPIVSPSPLMGSPRHSTTALITPPPLASSPESLMRIRTNSSISSQTARQAHRPWTRDYSTPSAQPSGEEDAASGADDSAPNQTRQRKRTSIFPFKKHFRNQSIPDEKIVVPAAISPEIVSEEAARTKSVASSTSNPARPDGIVPGKLTRGVTESGAKFTYEEWEDNPQEIWGAKANMERRETSSGIIAPDTVVPGSSLLPTSPMLPIQRTNSNPIGISSLIPTPNPDNEYLGYCKGAWKLQNGDRKALTKGREVEPWSRHPSSAAASMLYLSCQTKGCAFRSNIAHADTEVIWNRVFTFEARGIKLRWPFLAKSHVQQKVVVKQQYSFKCLFCVFLGGKSGVYHGMEYYLDHIVNEHRGRALGDVVLYKTSCINDRIAENDEDFDICLYPMSATGGRDRGKSEKWMSAADGPFDPNEVGAGWGSDAHDSVFSANEPWNEGLSDFSYRGSLDPTELE